MTDGRRSVLIVEDEPIVRMSACDMMEDAGYDAIEAADADEAIALLESRDDIALVFTDVEMPGSINGAALAAQVHDRWPPIRVIVTSGNATDLDLHLPPHAEFIAKPYRGSQISAMMARMAG
ncbi:Response regulatory domain-containing protein [Sphingomonas antarctica]|uniref:response regulator n=1 Tax=Sphingomonas antarctica TaxID=2040274 RepID=UPI0039EAD87F